MNIFEGWFSPKQELSNDDQLPVVEETIAEPAPKTLESIQEAKESIATLQEKRQETLEKHRDTAQELAALGVREIEKDSSARTETYNAVLNPIEEELAAISSEIGEKREEFDLEPTRVTMLEDRLQRLEDLKVREEAQFSETEIAKQIAEYDKSAQDLTEEMAELGNKRFKGGLDSEGEALLHEKGKQRNEINQKISNLYRDDKIAYAHALRLQKIQELSTNTFFTKKDAQDSEYDENGQMRIK